MWNYLAVSSTTISGVPFWAGERGDLGGGRRGLGPHGSGTGSAWLEMEALKSVLVKQPIARPVPLPRGRG